jgi:hypothetical protein
MTESEKEEVRRLLDAHERTVSVCRACAETARDLAWEVRRGGQPAREALERTIRHADEVLADLGRVEMALAGMKAALW